MSLVILLYFLCAEHVSDINISIIRSFRLCCWIITSVVLFSVRCVLELWCGWFGWCSFCRLQTGFETCRRHKTFKNENINLSKVYFFGFYCIISIIF